MSRLLPGVVGCCLVDGLVAGCDGCAGRVEGVDGLSGRVDLSMLGDTPPVEGRLLPPVEGRVDGADGVGRLAPGRILPSAVAGRAPVCATPGRLASLVEGRLPNFSFPPQLLLPYMLP